jgi:hypothetical protein
MKLPTNMTTAIGNACRLAMGMGLSVFSWSAVLAAETLNSPSASELDLMIVFQGKGASLAYDGGVLKEAVARIPSLRGNRSIVSGNSSGSILSVYLSCFGFSDTSLAKCYDNLLHGDRTVIRKMQNAAFTAVKSLAGKRTELDHIEMKAFVAFALGVDQHERFRTLEEVANQSTAKPNYPMLIVSGNREVLEDRGQGDLLAARSYKVFNPRNWSVSWEPEVYEYYKSHPDIFVKENPDLVLGDSPYIGKALTYFVNRPMYDLLQHIPFDERTGDLRLVENPRDLLVAIMASVSEPTYFDPYVEPHPEKILSNGTPGELGTSRQRSYCGGAFSNLPAQDVRRSLPNIRVLGTGYATVPYAARELIKARYLVDIDLTSRLSGWWCDMELQQTAEVRSNMLKSRDMPPETEFELGAQMAKLAFDRGTSLPRYVKPPYFGQATHGAVSILKSDEQTVAESSSAVGSRLPTMRGLGPLLK